MFVTFFGALGLLLSLGPLTTRAQVPSDAYSYSRSSAFSYLANGLLASETIEPTNSQLCVTTTYTYGDAYGNKTAATTANCAGASGLALIDGRSSNSAYASQTGRIGSPTGSTVPVPAGAFATSAANALSHGESRIYDPRFGVPVSLTGPNALSTSWTLDDYGRKTLEVLADGTRTAMYYCWLAVTFNGVAISTASNTPGCPSPAVAEIPGDAVRFEHSVAQNSSGTAIGAFARIYYDRAGRKIRAVGEGFDGATQPGGAARLIVQDTDYNAYGAAIVSTQPYFLDTGSSLASGTSAYGMSLTEYDALGRPTATYTTDPATVQQVGGSVAAKAFGNRGTRQAAVTSVQYNGLTTITTNDKGQPRTEEKNPGGLLARITDASGSSAGAGAQLVHQHDAFGNLAATKDALGNITRITYDIRGRKVSLNDPDAGVTAYCYDAAGQLKAQQTSKQRGSHTLGTCPSNAGTGTVAPAVAGWTTMAYDKLGRMTSRAEPEYTSTWNYDTYAGGVVCNKGIGKLCGTSTSHGVSRKLVYDSLGRPESGRTDLTGDPSFTSALSYDANGRVASQTYPTGVRVSYQYTARGYLRVAQNDTALTLAPLPTTPGGTPGAGTTIAANTLLWQALALNAWGKAEQQSYANGINSRAVFDAQSGRLTNLTAGPTTTSTVVDQRYRWDSINLLTQRIDARGDGSGVQVADDIQYDRLGRLTQYQVSGNGTPASRTVTLQYNALGMLLYKSDVGNYSYPTQGVANGRPHAVQSIAGSYAASYSYDLNGNAVTATGGKWRSIAYTSFNLPDDTNGVQGPAGSPKATWRYDENHQRIKDVRVNASGTRTTWNLHPDNQGGLGFEHELAANGTRSNRHYLSAGGMPFAVIVTTGALPTPTATQTAPAFVSTITAVKLEYWHKDQLGSLIATTDHTGAVTARYAYDPFGKRRYTNSTYDAFGNLVVDWTTDTNNGTDRGFTGHEHLDDLGLVHMNGRVFDPTIGRFLQADPLIQDPTNLQNFDRYSYCMNSPLICTDPSGHSWLSKTWKKIWNNKIFRVVVAVVVSYVSYGYGSEWAATWLASTQTAATVGYSAATINAVAAAGGGAAAGFSTTFVATSGDVRAAFKAGLQGAVTGVLSGGIKDYYGSSYPASRIVANGVAGGMGAVLRGDSFASGFKSDAVISSLAYLNVQMRTAMIDQSKIDSRNDGTGLSQGMNGDGFKLAGGRFDEAADGGCSPLGCWQGGPGSVFGIPYQRGGFIDLVTESFAGPHDYANSPWWYNSATGNIRDFSDWSALQIGMLDGVTNYTTSLAFATPFALSTIIEQTNSGVAVRNALKARSRKRQ